MTDAIAQHFEELAEQFENDLHAYTLGIWYNINNSANKEPLIAMGKDILPHALNRAKCSCDEPDTTLAWCAILHWILEQHYDMSLGPQNGIHRNNTAAWIEFAQYCLNGHIRQVQVA